MDATKPSKSRARVPKPLKRGGACMNCRFLKIKCDGNKLVCGPCELHPRDDECEYADDAGRSRTKVLEDTVSRLEARLLELENPESSTTSVALHDPHQAHNTQRLSISPPLFHADSPTIFSPFSPAYNFRIRTKFGSEYEFHPKNWRHKGSKSSKTVIEHPGVNWRKTSVDGSSLILSVVKEAAMLAPIAELKKPACTALLIFKTTQIVKENKEAYEQLGYNSSGLIIAIWRSFKEAEDPEEWLSAEMRDILEDLSHTLENICSFVNEQLSKSKAFRVIFSRADSVKINEYREHLNYAMQKFEIQSHMNINDVIIQVLKNDHISDRILHRDEEDEVKHALEIKGREVQDREIAERFHEEEWEISKLKRLKQVEINHQTDDERWYSDKLKKIEKETKDRKLELERLREAACALDEANRMRQAEEEEIAQLKRTLAAEEDNRRSEKKSSRQEDEEEDEEWEGDFMVEEASDEERPVRQRSKVKRNASGSPKRRPVALEDLQSYSRLRTARRKLSSASLPEEDSQSMGSAKTRMALRNLSSASFRVQETEDDYTDEEDDYAPPPPRKSPKVKRKYQTPNVDDLMTQLQGFTQRGGSNSRSFSPPTGPYGYGVGMPGTVVNAGVGNITNTTIANVGNDNSVVEEDHAVEVIRVRLELVVLILWYTIFSVYSHLLTC